MTEVTMIDITGDSGEYEFLIEAVELSKDVEGICIEIGLRLGMGTKTIIDAVRQYCPEKVVVSVDPFGSILYTGREMNPPCRLDYTNDMKIKCLSNIYQYIEQNPVYYQFYNWTDEKYFELMEHGIPTYDLEENIVNKYSFAHLDGPHYYSAIAKEIMWFNNRMKKGAVICIDDISEDFIDIKPIDKLFEMLKWQEIKKGLKKGIWQKC